MMIAVISVTILVALTLGFRESGVVLLAIPVTLALSDTTGLSSAEFHFHFLSSDRTKGGHVLDVNLTDLSAEWDLTSRYVVDLE